MSGLDMAPDVAADVSTMAVVERAIRRSGEELYRAANLPVDTRNQRAERARRFAEMYERRARWWGVAIRWVFTSGQGTSWVFASAALAAQRADEVDGRQWRSTFEYLTGEAVHSERGDSEGVVVAVDFRSAS